MDMITRYEVTPVGCEQITRWMLEHYHAGTLARMTPHELTTAVKHWASKSESTEHGELEMPAHMTRSCRIEYLTPDRRTVVEAV